MYTAALVRKVSRCCQMLVRGTKDRVVSTYRFRQGSWQSYCEALPAGRHTRTTSGLVRVVLSWNPEFHLAHFRCQTRSSSISLHFVLYIPP